MPERYFKIQHEDCGTSYVYVMSNNRTKFNPLEMFSKDLEVTEIKKEEFDLGHIVIGLDQGELDADPVQ